jgi:hypothetical protein
VCCVAQCAVYSASKWRARCARRVRAYGINFTTRIQYYFIIVNSAY